jgi:hypothetical protein
MYDSDLLYMYNIYICKFQVDQFTWAGVMAHMQDQAMKGGDVVPEEASFDELQQMAQPNSGTALVLADEVTAVFVRLVSIVTSS